MLSKGGRKMTFTNSHRNLALKMYLDILQKEKCGIQIRINKIEEDIVNFSNEVNKLQLQETSYSHQERDVSVHLQNQLNTLNETIRELKQDITTIEKKVYKNTSSLYSIVSISDERFFLLVRGTSHQRLDDKFSTLGISTPMGKHLLGQKVGHEFDLNDKEIEIIEIL